MHIVLFDDQHRDRFFPITMTRSIGDLRVGILKLRQRLEAQFEVEDSYLLIDDSLEPLYQERHPDWDINIVKGGFTLFLNVRLRVSKQDVKTIMALPNDHCLRQGDTIIAAKFHCKEGQFDFAKLLQVVQGLKVIENTDIKLWEQPWDLIAANKEMIQYDFENFFYDKDNYFETEMGVTILNPYNVWIGEGASLKSGVIIDASEGPVVIDEGVTIMPQAVILGPAYIGKNSVIKVGAKIYEGTSIGPVCKIGGEVEDTIIQGYSNKQHDGFLGHSYLGEWVNLGADTNNSDLKNTYQSVKMYSYAVGTAVDTGNSFLGCIIGDHAKTGINVSINTGTVIGVGSNLYGRDLVTGWVPSFRWGEANTVVEYRLDKFLETAEAVKRRRKKQIGESERALYSALHKIETVK